MLNVQEAFFDETNKVSERKGLCRAWRMWIKKVTSSIVFKVIDWLNLYPYYFLVYIHEDRKNFSDFERFESFQASLELFEEICLYSTLVNLFTFRVY